MQSLSDDPVGVDTIAALESCAVIISSCDTQALDGILSRLLGIPANRRVLDAIGKGLNASDPIIGANPFFAASLVVPVLRAHAFSSPDVAVTYLVQGLNNFLQTAHAVDPIEDQNPDAFLAQTIGTLTSITPAAQRNSQDRVRLSLLSLADLGARLPKTAERAQAALQKLVISPASAPPTSTRSRAVGLLLGGIGLAGALGVILWKSRPRMRSLASSTRVLPTVKTEFQAAVTDTDARKQALLEDAVEAVYNRKGSEDLTLAEACEAVRELLPSGDYWSRADVSDRTIAATIKHQIPDWF